MIKSFEHPGGSVLFIGHIGAALAAKRFAPKTSLGTLVFGACFLDLIWPIFLLLGLEHVRIAPGITVMQPFDFYDYPISHSLLTVAGWSLALGLFYFALSKYRRGAWVLGICVLSHWFLDWVVHRPDLPLWPGEAARHGLGLWNSWPEALSVETAVFGVGLHVYLRCTRAMDRKGVWILASLVLFLMLAWAGALLGGAPPSVKALAWGGLILWLLPFWAAWADRHRGVRGA